MQKMRAASPNLNRKFTMQASADGWIGDCLITAIAADRAMGRTAMTRASVDESSETSQATELGEADSGSMCDGWLSLLIAHDTGIYGVLGLLSAFNEIDSINVRRVQTEREQGVTAVTLFLRSPVDVKSVLSGLTGVKSVILPEEIGPSDEYSLENHPFGVVQVH